MVSEPMQTPGQAAYEAYWTRESGFVVTPWGEALSPSEREAWEAAAQAAFAAFADAPAKLVLTEADRPQPASALTALRSGITGLIRELDESAAATRPSRKSEIESELAIALRRLLEES